MKQTITIDQFQQLSEQAQEKARGILPKQIGSRVFATLDLEEPTMAEYNGIHTGVIAAIKDTTYQIIYETTGSTGPTKHLKNIPDYPLFSLGELVQIMRENKPHETLGSSLNVDSLWEDVKQLLEQ